MHGREEKGVPNLG